jgi:hypothetical protein
VLSQPANLLESRSLMRGCALQTLLLAALWLGLCGGLVLLLQQAYGRPPSQTAGPSLLIGGIAGIAFLQWLSAAQAWRQRHALSGRMAGIPPTDGRQAVLVGQVQALGATIVTPFDGAPCVAYRYEITEHVGSGKKASHVTHYKGVALVPCVVITPTGTYGLLAVPEIDGAIPESSRERMLAKAADYIQATTFTSRTTSARELEKRWSDTDGAYRSDVSYVDGGTVDLANCRLIQQHVPSGAEVCVFGLYSEAKGGIVAHANWGKPTRLVVGSADQAARLLASSVRTRLIVGLIIGAGASGLFWAFASSL